MSGLELVVVTLATFRVTRLVVHDDFPPVRMLREWWLCRWPASDTMFGDDKADRVRGGVVPVDGVWYARQPHWLGDLVSCVWCVSVWVAAAATILWAAAPALVWWVGLPLALSAATGIIHGHAQ